MNRSTALCLVLLAAVPAGTPALARPMQDVAPTRSALTDAWQRVVQAQSWMQQAYEVHGFLTALANEGRRPADLGFDARNIDTGRAVAADDPDLLQRPQSHEVTLSLDGRFYVFRPLSRASLEPLMQR